MKDDEWRLAVKVKDRRALAIWMAHKGFSGRGLAAEAGLGQAIVGHILSGRRDTCKPATAAAIEKALDVPAGFFFEPKMSRVVDAPRRRRAA